MRFSASFLLANLFIAVAQAGGPCTDGPATLQTTLAGVPAILSIPKQVTKPPIVLWHGFGPPASEAELMKALPLDDVAAVKVYLGLPLFGERAPAAGSESVAQRQAKDYGALIFEPIVMGAARELPGVLGALRERKCLGPKDQVGLFGFSAGGAAVLFTLIERTVAVRAAVTVNAPTGLSVSIDALERATQQKYPWSPATRELAERSDAVHHASEIAAGASPPALLMFHGADDHVVSPQGAASLHTALLPFYERSGNEKNLNLVIAPGVSHDWTEPHTLEDLRRAVSDWFNGHL